MICYILKENVQLISWLVFFLIKLSQIKTQAIMKKTIILFISAFFFTFNLLSQEIVSRVNPPNPNAAEEEQCFQKQVTDYLLENSPEYKEGREQAAEWTQEILQNIDEIKSQRSTYIIPVVFHVIHKGEPVGEVTNISDAQLLSCIDALNRDFAGTSEDGGVAQSSVPAAVGNTNIQFCLANVDPDGNPHSGINRIDGTSVQGYAANGISAGGGNEIAVKDLSRWDNRYYMNVWVVSEINGNGADVANPNSFAGGVLGYAYLPPANISFISDQDGIVVLNLSIGNDPDGSQGFRLWQGGRLNRTMTHEVGHYLDLYHTFEGGSCSENNCNTQGDFCCDTPPHPQNNSFNACANPNCGGSQQVENYMDYTSETCYEMFSVDQSNRMIAALEGPRSALWNTENCEPAAAIEYDAGITGIIEPEGSICGSNFVPIVQLRNFGVQTLTSVTINYSWGTVNNSFNWTGNLASGATVDVTLPSQTSANAGNFTFTASTENPNNEPDQNTGNDESSGTFEITGDEGVLDLTIQLDCYADEITWNIRTSEDDVLIDQGGGYEVSLQMQEVNRSYCLEEGCYIFTINDSYGDGLNGASEPQCDINGNYFMRDGSGATVFQMTAPDGNFGHQARHEFCIGDATPTLSLEDIDPLSNVKLYPNPTNGQFTIELPITNEEVTIQIMDVTGRTVTNPKSYNTSPAGQIVMDISTFKKGIYLVVLQTPTKKVTQRISLR